MHLLIVINAAAIALQDLLIVRSWYTLDGFQLRERPEMRHVEDARTLYEQLN